MTKTLSKEHKAAAAAAKKAEQDKARRRNIMKINLSKAKSKKRAEERAKKK